LQVRILMEVNQHIPQPLSLLFVEFLIFGNCFDDAQNAEFYLTAFRCLFQWIESVDQSDGTELLNRNQETPFYFLLNEVGSCHRLFDECVDDLLSEGIRLFVKLPQQLTQANQNYFAHTRSHIVQTWKKLSDDSIEVLISYQLSMVLYNWTNAIYWLKLSIPTAVLNQHQCLFQLCFGLWNFREIFFIHIHNAFFYNWLFNWGFVVCFNSRAYDVVILSSSKLWKFFYWFFLLSSFFYFKVDVCLWLPSFTITLSVSC
jgi:hypothetical protein